MEVVIDGSLPITVPAETEEEAIEAAVQAAHDRGHTHVTEDMVEVVE